MKKLNCFYIIIICALSACGVQAGDWRNAIGDWYSIDQFNAMLAPITSFNDIQNAIKNLTPQYIRNQDQESPRYNFKILINALKGDYGHELQELAEKKASQLKWTLAGEGLTQAAKAQAQTWSGKFNLATNWLQDKLSPVWSNYARPGIEGLGSAFGSASRYLVPTKLSQYAQTFPTVQKFTSLPRETQNLYLGIAAPLALAAAYKLGRGAYQWWNKPTTKQLLEIESLQEQDRLLLGTIGRLTSGLEYFPKNSSEYQERMTEIENINYQRRLINEQINDLQKKQQELFISIQRPLFR